MSDDVKKTEVPKEKTSLVAPTGDAPKRTSVLAAAPGGVVPDTTTKAVKTKKKLGKGKKKKRRRIVIAIVVVLVLALVWFLVPRIFGGGDDQANANAIYSGDITAVERQDVSKTVSLNGTLESAKSMAVYSTLNSAVNKINVKVGDQVNKGQHLVSMDTKPITDELNSQVSALNETRVTSQNSVLEAKDNFEKAQRNMQNNSVPEVLAAEKALRAANEEHKKAQRSFKELRETKAAGILDALLQQEAAVRAAYHEVENAQLDHAKIGAELKKIDLDRDVEIISMSADQQDLRLRKKELADLQKRTDLTPEQKQALQTEIESAIANLEATLAQSEAKLGSLRQAQSTGWSESKAASTRLAQARDKMGMARREYRAALRKVDNQLAEAQDLVAKTQDDMGAAKLSVQEAKTAAAQQLAQLQRGYQSAQAGANASAAKGQQSVSKLRADIGSARVTAPMSGVVTSVNAKVGSPAQGALLTVEDNQNLVVKTAVKEKDVSKLAVGQAVTFKTPATGDKEYTGTVAFISPAASSGSPDGGAGADASSGAGGAGGAGGGQSSVSFPVEIKVNGDLSGLRLGSTVKSKVIVQGAKQALAVPSSAVIDAPMPVGAGNAGAGGAGEVASSDSGSKPNVVLAPGAPVEAQEGAKNPSVAGTTKPESAASDPNVPKSVLVLENAASKTPKVKEVKVKVLVEGTGMTAIEAPELHVGSKILNNATQYMHLIGGQAQVVDTPITPAGTEGAASGASQG